MDIQVSIEGMMKHPTMYALLCSEIGNAVEGFGDETGMQAGDPEVELTDLGNGRVKVEMRLTLRK